MDQEAAKNCKISNECFGVKRPRIWSFRVRGFYMVRFETFGASRVVKPYKLVATPLAQLLLQEEGIGWNSDPRALNPT